MNLQYYLIINNKLVIELLNAGTTAEYAILPVESGNILNLQQLETRRCILG